jgi:predicted nucleic acid-binding protein
LSVFVDTGILVAYANADDPRHGEAAEVVEAILGGAHGDAFTSDFVLAEAFNFIRQRVRSASVAKALDGDVFGRPATRPVVRDVLRVHGTIYAEARQHYLARWAAGLSFTDWTTVVLARHRGIATVATFDAGFAAWIEVVPTPSSGRRSRSRSAR